MAGGISFQTIFEWLQKFEGNSSWIYLDTVGIPTVGVGFALIPDERSVRAFSWQPSEQDAVADYRLVRSAPAGHVADYYRPLCRAFLAAGEVERALKQKTDAIKSQLQGWNFNSLPDAGKLALVEIAYNLGVGGLKKFVKLKAAIDARDWNTAAQECWRHGISDTRNHATQALFLSLV